MNFVNEMNKRHIYIDHREHADTLRQKLIEYGFEVEQKQLNIGDYLISPDTTVERKTARDFCISIMDGRLFDQAFRLARYCETPLMMIEGKTFLTDNEVDMDLAAIKGALLTLAQTFHLPVLRTVDESDTAWHMNQLSIQRMRLGRHMGPLSAYRPKKERTKKEYVLRALPGIGTQMAKTLLDKFGSVSSVINAPEEELLKVHGLGPKKVREIQNVIRDASLPYG